MSHDPDGLITRDHFVTHRPGCAGAPPPLHVIPLNDESCHYPAPRPLPGHAGVSPGPGLVGLQAQAEDNLGIDPTDNTTWAGRGYRQCAGMIGRFNTPDDWHGFQPIGAYGVRPA